jgi:hypothetical protein
VHHRVPEHRPHLAVHLHRNRQDDPGVFYLAGRRDVLPGVRHALCAEDLEYQRRLGADRVSRAPPLPCL